MQLIVRLETRYEPGNLRDSRARNAHARNLRRITMTTRNRLAFDGYVSRTTWKRIGHQARPVAVSRNLVRGETMNNQDFFRMAMAAVDAETDRMCANAGQITLGELAARLEKFGPNVIVILDTGGFPGLLHSYRGYYRFIATEPSQEPITVKDFLNNVKSAIGSEFTGYKGGEYLMTRMTPVWVSAYGDNSGIGIVGVTTAEGRCVLQTKRIDE